MRIPPVPVRRMTARMFTNSLDGHFILDRPPDADGGTAPSGDRRRSGSFSRSRHLDCIAINA